MNTTLIEPHKKTHKLNPYQVVALGFLAFILVGAFFLTLPISNTSGKWLYFHDALFTATSCVCVTGLAINVASESFTIFGQIIMLLLIQLGGLGFMTIASLLFIIIKRKITLKDRMTIAETLNQDNLQGVVKLTRTIVLTTFAIEFVGAVALSFTFIPTYGLKGIYYSFFHSISAFCNAGFDVLGATSLTPFQTDIVVNIAIMSLITLGGIGFSVMIDVVKNRRFSKFTFNTKVVLITSLSLILGGAVLFMMFEWNNPLTIGNLSFGNKLLVSFFQSVTPRTAGYATINQADLTNPSKLLTILYMFIGASPASTGGGIKTTTFIMLILTFIAGAKGNEEVSGFGRTFTTKFLIKVMTVIVLGLASICFTAFLMAIVEGGKFTVEEIIFECFSAFGTVGLTLGITMELSIPSKLAISLLMYIGRLGPLLLGIMFSHKKQSIKYPEGKIMIG